MRVFENHIPFWRLSGWLFSGFLFGIAAHSPWPYFKFGFDALSITSALVIFGVFIFRDDRARYAFLVLLAVLFGLWRFESSYIPQNLRFLDAKGFSYARATPNPWRETLSDRIRSGLPGDEGALLAGILYGERNLSKDARDAFRTAGMTHLIAVSGSNVMIIVFASLQLFAIFHISRRKAFIWLTGILMGFVWLVAPQAPVVRAAIMGWLVALAPIVGRIPSSKRLLLVAAAIFSFWKPWSLAYDPSFALSFLATGGLMTWGKLLDARLEKQIPWKGLRENLTMTISATLMTTPYAIWAFSQASLIGLVTNLVAVPLVPWAMVTGLIALAFPFKPFTLPAQGFLSALLSIAETSDRIGLGSWSGLIASPIFMIACYFAIYILWTKLCTDK